MNSAYFVPQDAASHVGRTFVSAWHTIDQARIDDFGRATDDPDPHHVDPDFCARHSPWGKPIAFGFLTISMLTPMMYQVCRYPLDGNPADGYPANYGFESITLIEPVPVDSRIRGHFLLSEVRERKPGQLLMRMDCTVEIEGVERPALTAVWNMLWVTPPN